MNEQPLPKGLKRVTVTALVLSAVMGFGAAQGIAAVLEPLDPEQLEVSVVQPLPPFEKNPELFKAAVKAMAVAQLSAWQSMKASRTVILIALSVTSALVFVSALRMIKPAGAPREGVRQLLAGATMMTAVLRTLEGAQAAAVAKRAGGAFDKVLSSSHELPGGWPDGFMALSYTGLSMLMSLVVAGGLLLLSLYFRSARVRAITSGLDGKRDAS